MPTPPIARESLARLCRDLNAGCTSLRRLGLSATTRIDAQRAVAERVIEGYSQFGAGAWERLYATKAERNAALGVLAEAVESQRIFAGLLSAPHNVPASTLARWVSGPVDLEQERACDGDTHGRDTAFELLVFALLRECNLNPQWEEPDIAVTSLGRACLIACKRPRSMRRINRRFRDACSQIVKSRTRYAADREPPFGVVMFSLSKLYDCVPIELPTAEDVERDWVYLDAFHTRFAALWETRRETLLAGVMFHLLRAGFDLQERLMIQRQYLSGVGLTHAGPSGGRAMNRIIHALKAVTNSVRQSPPVR